MAEVCPPFSPPGVEDHLSDNDQPGAGEGGVVLTLVGPSMEAALTLLPRDISQSSSAPVSIY